MAIATGTALALAGVSAAVGQGAASIYGAKSANRTNQQALSAQERDSVRAESLERQRMEREAAEAEQRRVFEREQAAEQRSYQREQDAARERARQEMMARDSQRWNDYVRIHEPHWSMGRNVLGSLYDMAGASRPSGSGAGGGQVDPRSLLRDLGPFTLPDNPQGPGTLPDVGGTGLPAMPGGSYGASLMDLGSTPMASSGRQGSRVISPMVAEDGGASTQSPLISLAEMARLVMGSRLRGAPINTSMV